MVVEDDGRVERAVNTARSSIKGNCEFVSAFQGLEVSEARGVAVLTHA